MRYLAADVGGTFTDLVLIDTEAGLALVDKVPSAERGSAAPVLHGLERIVRRAALEPGTVDLFVHGFTVGTNAFLMRRGARVVMIVTDGFRDVLEIGTQLRPHLYALRQTKPEPVVPRSRVVETDERIDSFGAVVRPLDAAEVGRVVAAVSALEPEAVAVCLNFSFLDEDHERRLGDALRHALPRVPVYLSCDVNPEIEEYPRANTTAVTAYVGPVIDAYVAQLQAGLAEAGVEAPLRLMRSDGGMATPRAARNSPATMLLSGPAGGVIAGAHLGQRLGVAHLVTFDMGGTSADFSAIADGTPRKITQRVVDGQPLRLPTLDIETISAGGGSIARVDRGGAIQVGPDSAGSVPGPACYGQGGTAATVTDASVVLGMLAPEDYLGGELAIDANLARAAIGEQIAAPLDLSVEEASLGVILVANAKMAQAIRTLSVERGLDVRRFSLLAFGGAGPLYAAYLMRDLGMRDVLVPRHPGVFAAEGLLLSDIRHAEQAPFRRMLADLDEAELTDALAAMIARLERELAADGVPPEKRRYHCSADCRYVGQFHEIEVPLAAPGAPGWWDRGRVGADFMRAHDRLYGHADAGEPLETVNIRVEAVGGMEKPRLAAPGDMAPYRPAPCGERAVYMERGGGWRQCKLYRRVDLRGGARLDGPAIVTQVDSTIQVLAGQVARVVRDDAIRIVQGEGEDP